MYILQNVNFLYNKFCTLFFLHNGAQPVRQLRCQFLENQSLFIYLS